MSNSVFLKPDENGNWGKTGIDPYGTSSNTPVNILSASTTLNDSNFMDVTGYSTVGVDVIITGTATVTLEVSNDYVNFSNAKVISSTQTGLVISVAGFKYLRAKVTSYTSGSVTVTALADLFSAPQSSMSPFITFQSGATTTGDGTIADVSGYTTLIIQQKITGGTGTVTFETSEDNVTWNSIYGQNLATIGAVSNALSASGAFRFNVSSVKYFKARVSLATSTTIDVVGYASSGSSTYMPYTAAFGNVDTNAANVNLQGVGAYNLIYDGTNWIRQRTATAVADNTAGTGFVANAQWGFNGATFDRTRVGKTYKYIEYLNLTTATATTVWTPTSTKKIRLMGIQVSVSAAAQVNIRVGTAGSGTSIMTVKTGGADTKDFSFGNGYLATNATTDVLEIYNNTGSTVSVWVTAWGTEE